MAKKVWRAKENCMMPWHDFTKGETVELDDSAVTDRVKVLFECLTPAEVKADAEAKKEDPDFKVMVQRLKAAKIPLKRGVTKAEVEELFKRFLSSGATAGQISDGVRL